MHLKDDIAELIDCSVNIRGYLWTVNVVAFVFFVKSSRGGSGA